MKQCNKFLLTLGVLALFCSGVTPFGGVAFGTTPVVTVLPVFKDGTVTPTRIALDAAVPGSVYVTDPHAEGVLKFNSNGTLNSKFSTPKEPGGIAIANNGDLLVTQGGTYVVVLDPVTGVEKTRFGTFKSAFSITVDTRTVGGTGRIYVSDIVDYCVQVFDASYAPVTLAAHNPAKPLNSFGASQVDNGSGNSFFNRPAGVAFENATGRVAVVDSLNGKIKFFTPDGVYVNSLGSFGFDPTFVRFTYPQSISFDYTDSTKTVLDHAYVLDTYQAYVMTLDATVAAGATPTVPATWKRILDIGSYGHANGNLISPSDVAVDSKTPGNNRLYVTNGFGSMTVYGLTNLQPYNVTIDQIANNSMRINWSNPPTAFNNIRVYRSLVEGQLGTKVGGDLANTATSYPDAGLAQYTTYYYTVRAVDTSNIETTNVAQVSAKTTGTFGLTVGINGAGSVNGTVSCSGGTCGPTPLPSDTLVTLTATGTGTSTFVVWTGDCFTTNDTCLVSMDSAKSVTASFTATEAFRVDGVYFDNLQDAYLAAAKTTNPGTVIKVLAGTWPSTKHATEYMTAWQDKTIIIEGGYDATFTSNAGGSSTVVGRTNLTAGKVIMKQFKIK